MVTRKGGEVFLSKLSSSSGRVNDGRISRRRDRDVDKRNLGEKERIRKPGERETVLFARLLHVHRFASFLARPPPCVITRKSTVRTVHAAVSPCTYARVYV